MLKFLARNRCVSTILVENTDRLHRHLADWAEVWETIEHVGVNLHLVEGNAVIGKMPRQTRSSSIGSRLASR